MQRLASFAQVALGGWGRIGEWVDARVRSLRLLERSIWARRMLNVTIRGIQVESIPPYLGDGQGAILVSNYPSVSQTLMAIMKMGCRLPGKKLRLRAIARREVTAGANVFLRALGIGEYIFPALKNESGKYVLETDTLKRVLAHLDGRGGVLWLSITGNTRGNGLLESDLRTGAAQFSLKKSVPVVPLGLVTREEGGKRRS